MYCHRVSSFQSYGTFFNSKRGLRKIESRKSTNRRCKKNLLSLSAVSDDSGGKPPTLPPTKRLAIQPEDDPNNIVVFVFSNPEKVAKIIAFVFLLCGSLWIGVRQALNQMVAKEIKDVEKQLKDIDNKIGSLESKVTSGRRTDLAVSAVACLILTSFFKLQKQ